VKGGELNFRSKIAREASVEEALTKWVSSSGRTPLAVFLQRRNEITRLWQSAAASKKLLPARI
jgi:hypothetical protein